MGSSDRTGRLQLPPESVARYEQALTQLSAVDVLALFYTFGPETFGRGPYVYLRGEMERADLDGGVFTLSCLTSARLQKLVKLALATQECIALAPTKQLNQRCPKLLLRDIAERTN